MSALPQVTRITQVVQLAQQSQTFSVAIPADAEVAAVELDPDAGGGESALHLRHFHPLTLLAIDAETAMTQHHANLRVRFYPGQGAWTCVVQRMGPDGMPAGDDVVSATGATKDEARDRALAMTDDAEVRAVLRPHGSH